MNQHKFNAFVKEFPFLQQVFKLQLSYSYRRENISFKTYDHNTVDSISVRRVDENWLHRTLVDFCHNGSAGETTQWQDLWAVMPDGSVLQVPVKHEFSFSSNYAHTKSEKRDGEPIIEAMTGFEEAICFLMIERDSDDWRGQYDVYDHRNVVIFKASRRTTIAAEIEKARKQAEREVQIELEQVLDDSICPCCGQPIKESDSQPVREKHIRKDFEEKRDPATGLTFLEMLEQSLKDEE